MKALLVSLLLGVLSTAPRAALAPQDLNGDSLDTWLARILPAPDELTWRDIPWRPRLWEALSEAREQDKPVLLWAMNGHPLGCT